MANSNHGCYHSATVNHDSITGTPALHMADTPPPLQTLLSFEAFPDCPDFDELFQFSEFGFGDSVNQPELLPMMEDSEEEQWLEGGGGGDSVSVSGILLSTCSDNDKSCITSIDLSSGSGSVVNENDFSSFSSPVSPTISLNSQFQPDSSFAPLPTTSTNTHATLRKESRKRPRKEEEEVMFIVHGNTDALYDGYSWRKYGEKSIKHRDFRRSYYRCGHDGCKVRKQVERSTENHTAYLITYYGRHNHYANTSFACIGYN